ncbi:MAG: M17 family metallopeptidase [Alphaproteobacteria bacterium]
MARSFQLVPKASGKPVPITPVTAAGLDAALKRADAAARTWVRTAGFTGRAGAVCLVPGGGGKVARVFVGHAPGDDLWALGNLSKDLPEGVYALDRGTIDPTQAALGWAIGTYAFARYKKVKKLQAELIWPEGCDRAHVRAVAEAVHLVRDLIDQPAQDMTPAHLAEAAVDLAKRHDAEISVIVGDELLERNFPAIHAVGRASATPPRLIDIVWGDPKAPKVTLVGKGVTFDTGGLDLKPASGMQWMKKDMGGAANVLGLAHIVMSAKLNLRLRVLVPAVENAVSGSAYHPMDVIRTRKGITVEIGNTDAEGRVILSDALAEAAAERPDLIFDFATLTGAARVALGPELPAMFCNDDALAEDFAVHAARENDPLWRLPLWDGYRPLIDGKTADITNSADSPFAGAITAALFLREFVGRGKWAHFDLYAWNAKSRPGRPEGGEAMVIRAAFALLRRRYGG